MDKELRRFTPAYAAKVEVSGSLAPKFEKEIQISKPQPELKLPGNEPPHAGMNQRFTVLVAGSEGVNLAKPPSASIPRGAVEVKMRTEEAKAAAEAPKAKPKTNEVLEEVVLVPRNEAAEVPDGKVLERIERMMRAEHRARELEEENRVLTKTIARLQAEVDRLKENAK